jgi:hypothetical protein
MTIKTKSISIGEYASELRKSGFRVLGGTGETLWVEHEFGSLERLPTFTLTPPGPTEITNLFWKFKAALVTYLIEPDDSHPANAFLYTTTQRNYAPDKLSSVMRRNLRKGFREFSIEPISPDRLLIHGLQAFCDTRKRNGLNDGTVQQFNRRFALRGKCKGHIFIGAWKENMLAAFVSLTEVADWVLIEGSFSANSFLQLRPNEALMSHVLSDYLINKAFRIVSFGTSSVESTGNHSGLHAFKTKVGFEIQPVHRAFLVHPMLRPVLGSPLHSAVKVLLRLYPQSRLIRKADGVLERVCVEKKTVSSLSNDESLR